MNNLGGLIRPKVLAAMLLASLILASGATAAPKTVEEFPLGLETRPAGITGGPDGNLWFVESGPGEPGGNAIGRITAGGSITKFSIPTEKSAPMGITAGPDGNLWFTESNASSTGAGQIGRISPTTFTIDEFPASGQPRSITTGPDGNLWFVQENRFTGSSVARITPNGQITDFSVPVLPREITSGPDGNLWFTGVVSNGEGPVVARMTPGGQVSAYPLAANSSPGDITPGPEGNLWFTQGHDIGIGRVTPGGDFSEFAIERRVTSYAITLGPDGNLWFASGLGRRRVPFVGRLTPDGHLTRFRTEGGDVTGLTPGPDGNVWYTAYIPLGVGASVGRILTGIPSADIGQTAMVHGQRWARLKLSCGGGHPGSACRGTLSVTAQYRRGKRLRQFRVAHRRYAIASGDEKKVALRLTRKALRAVNRRSQLGIWVNITARGIDDVRRRVTLRSRRSSATRRSGAALGPARALPTQADSGGAFPAPSGTSERPTPGVLR